MRLRPTRTRRCWPPAALSTRKKLCTPGAVTDDPSIDFRSGSPREARNKERKLPGRREPREAVAIGSSAGCTRGRKKKLMSPRSRTSTMIHHGPAPRGVNRWAPRASQSGEELEQRGVDLVGALLADPVA